MKDMKVEKSYVCIKNVNFSFNNSIMMEYEEKMFGVIHHAPS